MVAGVAVSDESELDLVDIERVASNPEAWVPHETTLRLVVEVRRLREANGYHEMMATQYDAARRDLWAQAEAARNEVARLNELVVRLSAEKHAALAAHGLNCGVREDVHARVRARNGQLQQRAVALEEALRACRLETEPEPPGVWHFIWRLDEFRAWNARIDSALEGG